MLRRRLLAAAAALGAALAGRPEPACAGEVSPNFLVKEIVPGRIDAFQLTLKTDQALEKMMLQPVDFTIDREGKFVVGDLKSGRYSAKSWCRFKPAEVVLTRGREVVLDVPLLAPVGTPGGEYYMAFQVSTHEREKPLRPGLNTRMEANVLVVVVLKIRGGTVRVAGEVIDPVITVQDSIPQIRGTFHNTSNVALVARSAAVVRDAEGKVFDRVLLLGAGTTAEDGQVFMLPETLRNFEGSGNRKLPPGRYTAEIFSVFGKNNVRAVTHAEFEVRGGPVAEIPPLQEVQILPEKTYLEITPGGVKFTVVEFKNRGLGAVDVVLSAARDGVSFFPPGLRLEPGKRMKVRIGIKLPPTESPRQDVPLRLALEGGADKDAREFLIALYAPGAVPKAPPPGAPVPGGQAGEKDR
jgi:hypothetical protein